ncbi:MAG: SUMF1/EgtB/PvdO family nonheme iron enzyme [Planctomycetaceae bacterium]|nr:SUMF1/EgtB/PvdO family nonheme iron enzyme [Planctomycetaceae bacterium]
MTEREIFQAALELGDPAARAAYVAKACGDNPALRAEVEELLRTHDETSQFLETPATATNAVVEKTVIGNSSIEDDDSDGPPSDLTEFSRYLAPATRPGWIGRLGHYEIEQILGRGAFGIVAKAFDDKLHRVVAIKFMNPTLAATSPPRKRFLREARTAAAVTHENIVAIYAVEEEPIPYLVMEYIPGQTLQQRMDANGPFDVPEILKLGRQIASGLAAAHAANLIHRDIKPANILLTGGTNERAKISDFGLARAVDDASLTSSGLIAGTPMYMSPEQARGETLDHRTDLFSLGSVLYQMASGRPPFRAANTIAVLKRVCEDRPRPLDDVMPGAPEWLQTIIFRLMEKDPGNRYQSAEEVAELLERCETELRHNGRVTSVFTAPGTQVLQRDTLPNSVSRRNVLARLIAGVTSLVLLVGFVVMNGGKQAPEPDKTNPVTTTVMPLPMEATAQKPSEAVGWHGWPADAPKPAIAPFDAEQAKKHQEEWAAYLKVPVEYTNSIGMKFRLIPPGEFLMGSTPEEIAQIVRDLPDDSRADEWIRRSLEASVPQHRVLLTKPFFLGVHEVTQSQFLRVTDRNPSAFSSAGSKKDIVKNMDTSTFPVESARWEDCTDFLRRLSKLESLSSNGESAITGYRLPSEAEWEFACRAGTQTRYWSGDVAEDIQGIGWHFMPNVRSRLHSVGELAANPFGLHDIHGNVGEFVNDHWRQDYYRQFEKTHSIDPRGPIEDNPSRIVRGGGFNALKELCGSFPRFVVTDSSHWIGFRAVLNIDAVRYSESQTTTGLPANAPKPAITPSGTNPAADREAVLAEYYAVNRRAAEKALSVGGSVLLERLPDHEFIGLGGGDALPDGPFLVRIWSVFNSSTVTNADLDVLRGLRHIREISASASFNRLDAAAIPHIAAVRAPLQFLSFHHPIKTSDLAALPTLEELTFLWVLGHDVDDDWACLEKFPHLRSLNINQGPIPSLASLSKYPQLRSLALTVTEEPDLSAVPELQQQNPRLRVTVQVGTNHRVVGQDPLRAAVPDLLAAGLPLLAVRFDGTLNPLNNENVETTFDEGVMSVKLDAIPAGVRLSDAVRGQLTLLGLQLLVATGHQDADRLAEVLADRHDMQTLYLQDSDLTDTGLKKLEALIGLQYLDISGTKVTEEGVKAFRAAVPGCILHTSTGTLEPDYAAEPAYPGRPRNVSQSGDWHGWPADAPPPAIAPFDADQAKKHQEQWAAYLKVPVEYTNSIGMKFRLIPPGEFLMGGTPEEIAAALEADLTPFNGNFDWWSACLQSEGPRHRVRLTRPFYLGAHEVTQRQYQEIIGENPSENSPTGPNRERVAGLETANFPVEFLSWHDAVQFCNRLNEREQRSNRHLATMPPTLSDTGTGYRLPTEAEWEFACRAGTTSRYWTGHDVDSVLKAGWFQVNDGGRTHAVGELLANPFGLFDVHGNAWEWTADGWDESWYQQFADTVAVNPICPLTDQPVAMMKTGTWPAFEHFCRAASRIPWPCDARNSLQGMRVTLSVEAVRESLKLTGSLPTGQETLSDYYARNRRAAERALAVASDSSDVVVEISQLFEWRRITAGQKLPEEPFVVRQWSVKNATDVSSNDLEVLAGLRHLLNLNVMAKSGLDAGCVPRIGAVRSSLKELGLGHIKLKTSDLAELPVMPHVHLLWLSTEQVDDEWRFLKKFPALRVISLYGSPVPDLRPLGEARHLRRLVITTWGTAPDLAQIREVQTDNSYLRVLLDMGQKLTTLGTDPAKAAVRRLLEAGVPVSSTAWDGTLSSALAIDEVDQKIAPIYTVPSIPREVTLTDELRGLLTHVELQNVHAVGHQQADALVDTLKDREDVEILNLVNSDLTDAGLRSLQRLTGLRLVSLNGTKVTAEGIAAFHRAVPGCHLNTDAGDVPVDYMAVPEPQATAP